jgi:hypothetical protein
MKLRMEPIHVECKDRKPNRLIWNGKLYRVIEIEDEWRWAGKWWITLGDQKRSYFRVRVRTPRSGESTMKIFYENHQWTLSRELD